MAKEIGTRSKKAKYDVFKDVAVAVAVAAAGLPDIQQYAESDLSLIEKKTICNWQNTLCNQPGATSTMVESLEMIIKFSNDIIKEEGLEIPARLTWMDGLKGVDSVEESKKKQIWTESSFPIDEYTTCQRQGASISR